MSDTLHFVRFDKGTMAPFDLDAFRQILARHGCEVSPPAVLTEDSYDVRLPPAGGPSSTGTEAGTMHVEAGRVIAFAIARPASGETLWRMSFELLVELGACMFPTRGQVICAAQPCEDQIPKDLLAECDRGVQMATSPQHLSRLL
jgi:hypothetical protein